MPRTKGRKKAGAAARPKATKAASGSRAGLPAPDSVVEVRQIERGGKVYRIIRTDEYDEYDHPEGTGRGRARKRRKAEGSRQ